MYHGKTTLSDSLLASNGIISSKLAGKVRYLDSREDEQERGITMKSSGISLFFKVIKNAAQTNAKDEPAASNPTPPVKAVEEEEFLINLIDSPGHVDFSSEVSTASRLCDGCLVLVDVVEGVCTQTHTVLRQALIENVRPILVLNKIDRLITELQMSPQEAYVQMNQILGQVNAIMGTFHMETLMADDARDYDAKMAKLKLNDDGSKKKDGEDTGDTTDWHLEDRDDSEFYFSPEKGNVLFSSAYDGWAFRTAQFARIYASKLGVSQKALNQVMWGDYYLDPKTKRAISAKGLKGRALKPFFVQFVLENIWAVYDAVFNDREKVEKIVKALNLKVLPRDLKSKDSKALLNTLMTQWLPLAPSILLAVIEILPSPIEAQTIRIPKLIPEDSIIQHPSESESDFNKTEFMKALSECDSNSKYTVAYVSKMFSVSSDMLPEGKRVQLTAEELRERRAKLLAERAAKEAEKAAAGGDSNGVNAGPEGLAFSPEAAAAAATARMEQQAAQEAADKAAEEQKGESIIGFARCYSGTVRVGQTIKVLRPKYNASNPDEHWEEIVVEKLYMLMGRELEALDAVPAGNVFGIGGLEGKLLKSGTLSSCLSCPSFAAVKGDPPILRVALEPTQPSYMNKLIEGLRLLNQSDPCVEVVLQETGEHVIVTAGELHLERCLKDLKERFAKIDIQVSPPIVPFKESLSLNPAMNVQPDKPETTDADSSEDPEGEEGTNIKPETPAAPLPLGTVIVTTPNKLATIRIRAHPLPKNVVDFIEKSALELRQFADYVESRRRKGGVGLGVHGEVVGEDGRQVKMREKLMVGLKAEIEKAVKEGLAGGEKELWNGVVDRIWSFGPKEVGSNLFINKVPGYDRNMWTEVYGAKSRSRQATEILDTANGEGENIGEGTEISARSIRDYEGSISTGFQLATSAGPLCAEPMMGVAFFLEEFSLDLSGADQRQLSGLSGQIITTVRDACRNAFLKWSPRLGLAMYSCDLQAPSEVLGKVYAVMAKRRGKILSEEMREGTPFFQIKALLPVVESFGFADDLRRRTAGSASPQLIFHGFELLDIDPFWVPSTQEELEDLGEKADRENLAKKYMEAVRKRKGMFVDKKIVERAEKQRTLKIK
ncbi:Cytoplasmic GTPase/eEF2-like protein (ribosomal biogenesis) [Blyttiomyces sp. JEL0837]|nr:Cytoplasmic GTPase/eEF2-like protein (ribosomal biogenesis) [Blyttiomyces sp. JEL0837]